MTQQGKNAIDLVLAESLIELSAKKPIDKITIKEITDKAGVIRPTFYNHFQDKYELIEWIIKTELLEPIKPLLNAGMIFEAIVLMLNNITANSVFYKKALKLEGAVPFLPSFGALMRVAAVYSVSTASLACCSLE